MGSIVPKVSVIIPVYNREALAISAVESVLNQTFKNFELIVVDDGSDDEPEKLAELVVAAKGQFIAAPHKGVSAARNVGLRAARGKWVALLDSDDKWLPNKLQTQIDYLLDNPDCKICQVGEIWYRNGVFVNPKKHHKMPNGEAFFQSLALCLISPSSVVFSRELFEQEGCFREELPICEDYDYWLRLTATHEICSLPEQLVEKLGGHDDQLSRSQPAQDRFRIYSMLCLLNEKQLVVDKFNATLEMLRAKAELMHAGAMKRQEIERAKIYADIAESSRSFSGLESNLENLISRMQNEINLSL